MPPEKVHDAFLSYNSKDRALVMQIGAWLADEKGMDVWLDQWNLVPADPWQEALEKALDQSKACVVFIGPNHIGPWQHEEMCSALDERVSRKTIRVVPVLLPGANREQREGELPRFLRRLTWVEFQYSVEEEEARHHLVCGINGTSPGKRNKVKKKEINTTVSKQLVDIELTINKDINSFSNQELNKLLEAIGILIKSNRSISIKRVKEGSIKITIALEISEAKKIEQAVAQGQLKQLKVVSAQLIQSSNNRLPGKKENTRHDIDSLITRGYLALIEKKYNEAKQLFAQRSEIDPDHADAHNNLAILLMEHFREYANARRHFERALEIDPDYADAHNSFGVLLMKHFKEHSNARRHFERALEIDPDHADAHNSFGVLLMEHFREYANARRHFKQTLEIDPDHANAHNSLGVLLMKHFKEYANARRHFGRALEIDPDHADAHSNLGVLLMEHFKEYANAGWHFERALEIDPDHATAHNNLGVLLMKHFKEYANTNKR